MVTMDFALARIQQGELIDRITYSLRWLILAMYFIRDIPATGLLKSIYSYRFQWAATGLTY